MFPIFFDTYIYMSFYTRVYLQIYEWLLLDAEEVNANVIQ